MIDRLLPPEQRRRRLVWLLVLSLTALTALSIRASVTDVDSYGQDMSRADRSALANRAVELATQAMTYKAATAGADIAAVKDNMTARMRADYDRTLPPASSRAAQAKAGVRV